MERDIQEKVKGLYLQKPTEKSKNIDSHPLIKNSINGFFSGFSAPSDIGGIVYNRFIDKDFKSIGYESIKDLRKKNQYNHEYKTVYSMSFIGGSIMGSLTTIAVPGLPQLGYLIADCIKNFKK